MVDKLVLERAQAFVGFQASSFGWCVALTSNMRNCRPVELT